MQNTGVIEYGNGHHGMQFPVTVLNLNIRTTAYISQNYIMRSFVFLSCKKVTKSKTVRWALRVACTKEIKNPNKVLLIKHERKTTYWSSRRPFYFGPWGREKSVLFHLKKERVSSSETIWFLYEKLRRWRKSK